MRSQDETRMMIFLRNPNPLVLACLWKNMAGAMQSERIVEADALQAVAAVARRHQLGSNLLLVCDDATWVAAGQQLQTLLSSEFQVMPHSLGRHPTAKIDHVEPIVISAQAHSIGSLVAIGSGTVNDVTKYAAHQLGCDYICVATAASMNGYSSATASLQAGNVKHSYVAKPPKAVVADLAVIAAAPRRLARAGLGDTLCRSTVAADRYLSHVVLGTPFEREIFAKLREHEPWLLSNIQLMKEGSMEYMRYLMHALLDAGDAMTEVQSSAVASQGEHMIAHTLEMLYGNELSESLHGEMIAVTASVMAHLQHKMLLSQPALRSLSRDEQHFTRFFGNAVGKELAARYREKVLPAERAEAMNAAFQQQWPEIKAELLSMIVPANGIERAYKEAGLATTPSGIGLLDERFNSALTYAYMTRERFTFLDLAAMNARRA